MNKEMLGRIVKKAKWIAFAFVATILITAIPVASWLTYERHVGALAEIDTPVSLYINSGAGDIADNDPDEVKTIKLEEQQIIYLDLSDIDVDRYEGVPPTPTPILSKDYVFCIRGEYLQDYYLQLAHTTNNQFSYEIFRTCEENTAEPEGDTKHKVTYYGAVSGRQYDYWYLEESGKIDLTPLNKQVVGDLELGKTNDRYYSDTYGSYTNTNVNKYAVPIYWQAPTLYHDDGGNEVHTGNLKGKFSDYYILRVSWSEERSNDRETDILYIAAGK